ncbi:MAG: DUF6873 family GME fold protein [Anaerovoracaceae bacterium]
MRPGYARCSCLPVDGQMLHNLRRGIASALAGYDADVLLTEPGAYRSLGGLNYGFIGGCGGERDRYSGRGEHYIQRRCSTGHPWTIEKIAAFTEGRGMVAGF